VTRTWKDTMATTLVAVVVLGYVAHLILVNVPFIGEVRGMAAVGLVLGIGSRWIGGRRGFKHERWAMLGNMGSVALGIATIVTGTEVFLALFITSIVALWAAATYVRLGRLHTPPRRSTLSRPLHH